MLILRLQHALNSFLISKYAIDLSTISFHTVSFISWLWIRRCGLISGIYDERNCHKIYIFLCINLFCRNIAISSHYRFLILSDLLHSICRADGINVPLLLFSLLFFLFYLYFYQSYKLNHNHLHCTVQ